jgi:hypothetical protein
MSTPWSRERFEHLCETINECLEEGFPLDPGRGSFEGSAIREAADRLGVNRNGVYDRLKTAKSKYGLEPDPERFKPRQNAAIFTVDALPDDGEPDAETLIDQLAARHMKRKAFHDASKLRDVQVHMPGPIGVAFFGDPHIDDPGCAWGDLKRDVELCRDTPGMMAVDVGDNSNNWVGRLMKLYSDQEVTAKQSLMLIEWLMTSLPWLLWEDGNHDTWNTEKGDPAAVMHRLLGRVGVMNTGGTRLRLNMPSGANFTMHVRHDFPGGSQFNPAHALVRETLFGFRDHIMACGHRHTTGYIPIFHNDPRRLCHGFRVGTYKDFDKYAREKGFQDGNWARSLAAVIDPAFANDPVRYITPFYSLEAAAEYLTWKRARFDVAKTAA